MSEGPELWELLYDSLGFHVEDDASGDLRKFCEALCSPQEETFQIVRPRPDQAGWALLFDVDECPADALPFLAQFVGVQITSEMSEEQIRNEIREPTGWKRGQPESLRVATRRTLKPVAEEELLVIIHPRTPEVGRHYIRTLLSQTPEPERTRAVIRAMLPAWEVLDYEAITGVTVADVTASAKWTTVADLSAAFSSVQALTEVLPTEI